MVWSHSPWKESAFRLIETLYGAIGDEAIAVRIRKQARKELDAYLECGLACRGFAAAEVRGVRPARRTATTQGL